MPPGWVKNLFRSKKRIKICLLGPGGAGKTTMLYYMKTGQPPASGKVVLEDGHQMQIRPTHGIDFENFEFEGWNFIACDVGGQQVYRQVFWELGVRQSPGGVIFVVDATDRANIAENRKIFEYAVSLLNDGIPVLVMANKQDLRDKNPMTEEEILESYGVDNLLKGHSVHVVKTSGMYGDGLKEAFEYLVDKVREQK
ncbi:MAG: ADP-ribosylation factor-like protein [Promethearchaeati archaeon SRVP18_Atabeyarchaeia-1]